MRNKLILTCITFRYIQMNQLACRCYPHISAIIFCHSCNNTSVIRHDIRQTLHFSRLYIIDIKPATSGNPYKSPTIFKYLIYFIMSNSYTIFFLQNSLYLTTFYIKDSYSLTGSTYHQVVFIGKAQGNNMIII